MVIRLGCIYIAVHRALEKVAPLTLFFLSLLLFIWVLPATSFRDRGTRVCIHYTPATRLREWIDLLKLVRNTVSVGTHGASSHFYGSILAQIEAALGGTTRQRIAI